MKKVSIILPVYNEGKQIKSVFGKILDFSKDNPDYDFIFVNDGSSDNSSDILKKALADSRAARISLLSYNKNKGKGYAIRTGMMAAKGDYLCFTDSDLAYSLDHLNELVRGLAKHDILIGSRSLAHKIDNIKLIRIIFGRSFNILTRLILGLKFKDMQAGLKGFRREVARDIFSVQKISGWSFDSELLYLAKKKKYSVGEIPAFISDSHKLKKSNINLLSDSAKMFSALIKIKLNDLTGKYGK